MGDAGTKGARLERVEAVCYSGYRAGQSPAKRVYPSEAQVLADLQLLAGRFRHLRMYDCSPHCQLVLELIRREKLPFKVMIGAYLEAESSNPKCPWGGVYEEAVLLRNRRENQVQLAEGDPAGQQVPRHRLGGVSRQRSHRGVDGSPGAHAARDPIRADAQGGRRAAGDLLRELRALAGRAGRTRRGGRLHLAAHLPRVGTEGPRRGAALHRAELRERGAQVPGQAGADLRGRLGHREQRPGHSQSARQREEPEAVRGPAHRVEQAARRPHVRVRGLR